MNRPRQPMAIPALPFWLAALVLVCAVLTAFWPVLGAGFINWDDGMYVAFNPWVLHGMTLKGLGICWGSYQVQAPDCRTPLFPYAAYLRDMVWPVRLAPFYPMRAHEPLLGVIACLALLVLMSGVAIAQRQSRPSLIVGWLWYVGSLVPMIGFVQAFDQARADRFTYFPMIGIMLMVFGALSFLDHQSIARKLASGTMAFGIIFTLAAVTFAQAGYWRGDKALWERTLAVTHDNAFAEYSLGQALASAYGTSHDPATLRQAIEHLERSTALNPDQPAVHDDLGILWGQAGNTDRAIEQFHAALAEAPRSAQTHNNLATALLRKGDRAGAMAELETAVTLDPAFTPAWINRGYILSTAGLGACTPILRRRRTGRSFQFAVSLADRPNAPVPGRAGRRGGIFS